jgi:predicted amidohydrolase YtcJ
MTLPGKTTLLRGGRITTMSGGSVTAMAVTDGVITWTGTEYPDRPGEVVDLRGALVTPAFVDSHVHATMTGLLLTGLDLTACESLPDLLRAVREFAARNPDAALVWGYGWDETRWPQRRPPTRGELDEALGGRRAYLSRIDGHSAVVTSSLAAAASPASPASPANAAGTTATAAGPAGFSPDGPLTRQAHHDARRAALAAIPVAQRRATQRAFLAHAASLGIGYLHECAGPDISGLDDLRDLLVMDGNLGPRVVGYWGQPVSTAEQARSLLAGSGAHGLAGDLFCDGSIGSRTAALREPYADATGTSGHPYLDAGAVAAHVVACTEAGVQAGFHVIGDAATAAVIAGFELAERQVGPAALARRRHRLEHLEMIDCGQAAALARWGVVASVQPGFDHRWGGGDGMYASRLGTARAAGMNPFAMLARAGVELAFGSDTPVTELGPWTAVQAATRHRTPASALTPAQALAAHIAGGHRAAGSTDPRAGTLMPGAPASYAIWDTDRMPALDGSQPPPRCLRTVVDGETIFGETP